MIGHLKTGEMVLIRAVPIAIGFLAIFYPLRLYNLFVMIFVAVAENVASPIDDAIGDKIGFNILGRKRNLIIMFITTQISRPKNRNL